MKKLKFNALQVDKKDMLDREQLKNVLGGDDVSATGDCQDHGEYCSTAGDYNCCSGYVCASHKCQVPTV